MAAWTDLACAAEADVLDAAEAAEAHAHGHGEPLVRVVGIVAREEEVALCHTLLPTNLCTGSACRVYLCGHELRTEPVDLRVGDAAERVSEHLLVVSWPRSEIGLDAGTMGLFIQSAAYKGRRVCVQKYGIVQRLVRVCE
jgi:hypothetical protein